MYEYVNIILGMYVFFNVCFMCSHMNINRVSIYTHQSALKIRISFEIK